LRFGERGKGKPPGSVKVCMGKHRVEMKGLGDSENARSRTVMNIIGLAVGTGALLFVLSLLNGKKKEAEVFSSKVIIKG
jgi:hypothetical protein